MLIVADDIGSKEFAPNLRNLLGSAVVTLDRLQYGDFAWEGRGPNDTTITVGVERKSIIDLVESMWYQRLSAFQVPGMVETYQVRYLLVEGNWRVDADGDVEWLQHGKMVKAFIGKRKVTGDAVYGFLGTLRHQALFDIVRTEGRKYKETVSVDSAWWIKREYEWWQKPWEDHEGLGAGGLGMAVINRPQTLVSRPNLVWKWVNCLSGCGPTVAKAASEAWKTGRLMANGTESEWENVVRGVDSGLAAKVIRQIRDGAKR